jgi:hypothetical protein
MVGVVVDVVVDEDGFGSDVVVLHHGVDVTTARIRGAALPGRWRLSRPIQNVTFGRTSRTNATH